MLRTIKSNIWLSGDVLYSITLSDQPFPKPIGRMKNYQTYFKMPCFQFIYNLPLYFSKREPVTFRKTDYMNVRFCADTMVQMVHFWVHPIPQTLFSQLMACLCGHTSMTEIYLSYVSQIPITYTLPRNETTVRALCNKGNFLMQSIKFLNTACPRIQITCLTCNSFHSVSLIT